MLLWELAWPLEYERLDGLHLHFVARRIIEGRLLVRFGGRSGASASGLILVVNLLFSYIHKYNIDLGAVYIGYAKCLKQ